MNLVLRASGGIAAAALILTGAAPTAASAATVKAIVSVPCSTPSLIAAVNAANTAGSGTLLLASNCTYTLTTASGVGRGPDGLPVILGNIDLVGGTSTHIARAAAAPRFRILEVAAGAVLHVVNTFVTGGNADGTIPTNDTGGGILNSRGTLVLTQSTVSGNTADSGAGISNDSSGATLTNTLVDGNSTRTGGGGGGGLYNDGELIVNTSILRANHANTNGGGLYNGQGGVTMMTQSTVDQNTAGSTGGGIFNAQDGHLTLVRTLIDRNTSGNGGGLFNAGLSTRVSLVTSIIGPNTPNNCAPVGTIIGCVG